MHIKLEDKSKKTKLITQMLLVAVLPALPLASSAAGLAAGQAVTVIADSPCDNVCVDPTCVPVPVDWIGAIPITNTFIIYPASACLCDNGNRIEGEGEFFLPDVQ